MKGADKLKEKNKWLQNSKKKNLPEKLSHSDL